MAIPLPSPEISSAAKFETSSLASERELLACTVLQQKAAASTTSVAIDLFMMLLLREQHHRDTFRNIIFRARSKRLGTSDQRFAVVPLRRWQVVGPRRGRRRRRPADRLGRRYQRGVHGVRQRRCNRGIRSIVAILLADILGHKCCTVICLGSLWVSPRSACSSLSIWTERKALSSMAVDAMTLLTVTFARTSLVFAETARSVTVMVSCVHFVLRPMPSRLAPAPPVIVLVS